MDIKLSIIQKVEDCFVQAENHFDCVLSRPKVSFDVRGQDAGRAYFPVGRFLHRSIISKSKNTQIKFNEALLEKNADFFLSNIVPHECAHLIVYELFGTKAKPHGKEWKGVMQQLFHADSSVRHNLDVSSVSNKPFIYSCSCDGDGIALSQRQHNRANKGGAYICRQCKTKLSFKFEKPLAQKKSLNKHQEFAGLYLHFASDLKIDEVLFGKVDTLLGRKRPLKIYTSINLFEHQAFQCWLRSKTLIRKYYGQINREEFEIMFCNLELSHAIYFFAEASDDEKLYWENLRSKGLVLRSIRV